MPARHLMPAALALVLVAPARADRHALPPSVQAPQAAAGALLPFEVTETTLPNGLKVIVVPTGFPNIVSLQIPVQAGSRNEVEPGKSGFAHFFEHMMFRGTKAYPPDAYQAVLTRAGARQNAYTTSDYTNYHTTFAKEDLETILKVEADRFQNLAPARRPSRPRRGPCSASTTRTPPTRRRSSSRSCRSAPSPATPTGTRRWAI
jgi:zinc protease